jgi:hypothetical protein
VSSVELRGFEPVTPSVARDVVNSL